MTKTGGFLGMWREIKIPLPCQDIRYNKHWITQRKEKEKNIQDHDCEQYHDYNHDQYHDRGHGHDLNQDQKGVQKFEVWEVFHFCNVFQFSRWWGLSLGGWMMAAKRRWGKSLRLWGGGQAVQPTFTLILLTVVTMTMKTLTRMFTGATKTMIFRKLFYNFRCGSQAVHLPPASRE